MDTLVTAIDGAEDGALAALWIFSDLLESVLLDPARLLVESPQLEAVAGASFPPLREADVYVAGMGRYHDASRRSLSGLELGTLVDSWSGLIGQAGGKLHVVQ